MQFPWQLYSCVSGSAGISWEDNICCWLFGDFFFSLSPPTPFAQLLTFSLLVFGRLPSITKLNGSVIMEGEREDSERFFIRYYIDFPQEEAPFRWGITQKFAERMKKLRLFSVVLKTQNINWVVSPVQNCARSHSPDKLRQAAESLTVPHLSSLWRLIYITDLSGKALQRRWVNYHLNSYRYR